MACLPFCSVTNLSVDGKNITFVGTIFSVEATAFITKITATRICLLYLIFFFFFFF